MALYITSVYPHLYLGPSRHSSKEQELVEEVESMKLELSRANQLVASLQKKGGEVLLMSPAAAKASALLKSGMSLTQIYSKYVEVRTVVNTSIHNVVVVVDIVDVVVVVHEMMISIMIKNLMGVIFTETTPTGDTWFQI